MKRRNDVGWLVGYSRWRYARARRGKRSCGECLRPVKAGQTWCRVHSTPEAARRRDELRNQRLAEATEAKRAAPASTRSTAV